MTRLESGAIRPHKEWHSLEEVVGAALERLKTSLGDRDVRVDLRTVPYALLDDVLIGQVIYNLVENATKYTPAGSPIEIRAWRDGEGAFLEVADRGPGLPPGEERRVFEKFHRAAETGGARGLGLGLAISRGFVEAHRGRIEAVNRPGGGLAFRLWLPFEGEPPPTESEAESTPGAGLEARD